MGGSGTKAVYLFEFQLSSLHQVSADNLVQIYPMHATHGTVPEQNIS